MPTPGQSLYIYTAEKMLSESVSQQRNTQYGCRKIRNKFARARDTSSDTSSVCVRVLVITQAKNADTGGTRNRNESHMRYGTRMFRDTRVRIDPYEGIIYCAIFCEIFPVEKEKEVEDIFRAKKFSLNKKKI